MSSDEEEEPMTASSPRRSSPRRRAAAAGRKRKISYRESTDQEDLENLEYEQELMVKKEQDDSEDDNAGDDTDSDSVVEKSLSPAKPQAKRQGGRSATKKKQPTQAELTCPHCGKVFSIMSGLTYHVEHFVCRKDQKPHKPKPKSKNKRPIKKEEEEEKREISDTDDDNESTEQRKQRPAKIEGASDVDDDDNSDEDFSSNDDSDAEEVLPPKRKRTKILAVESKDSNGDLQCQLCQKKFSTEHGLAYHIDKKVCRKPKASPKEAAAEKPKPKKRPPASKASGQKWKRFRGAKEDRTCPNCKRVFTSVLGKDYHCANRVCETKQIKKPFDTLAPGKKFVTQWGVVEVVKDDRATPTAEMDPKANDRYRQWKNVKVRLDSRRKEQYFSTTVHSLARRKRFGKLYLEHFQRPKPPPPHTLKKIIVEDESKAQRETWKIYTGTSDWRNRPPGVHRSFPHVGPELPPGPHPLEPEGCHPDRIVECVLIPDKRKWIDVEGLASEDATGTDNRRECVSVEKQIHSPVDDLAKPTKLFLQRRLLTEPYAEGSTRYCCVDCGRLFGSIVGCKYHVNSWACHRTTSRSQTKPMTRKEINAQLERHAGILMDRQENPYAATDPKLKQELGLLEGTDGARTGQPFRDRNSTYAVSSSGDVNAAVQSRDGNGQFRAKPAGEKRKWLPKKKREWAFYPQVWRSLGFKVVPKKPRVAPVSFFKKKKHADGVYPNAQLQNRINDVDDLQMTIKSFTEQLVDLRSETLGAYYPGVWKVLGFRKPSAKPFFVRRPGEESDSDDEDMEPVGAKRAPSPPTFVPQPPFFAYGPPVIIDVAVLAAEVDAGRYPSMKRNNCNTEESGSPEGIDPESREAAEENTHDDKCYICKDSRGILYLCDFCKKVNHLLCIRTRFLVKEPEPHDDFMCNKCIQYILQRRRRAERRRLRKGNGGELPESAQAAKEAPELASEDTEEADQVGVSNDPAPGEEFNYLAKQGQSVDQIVELLKDAQSRLQLLVETSKINDFRRSQFDGA